MVEHDTVRLLRECDAGIKMGMYAIEEVLDAVKDSAFQARLQSGLQENAEMKEELQKKLIACHDDGKDPNSMAKGMAWMKTNWKFAVDPTDDTIADLITDGCHMGIKSLARYLNQYQAADESSKRMTKRLIQTQEQLAEDIRPYL